MLFCFENLFLRNLPRITPLYMCFNTTILERLVVLSGHSSTVSQLMKVRTLARELMSEESM